MAASGLQQACGDFQNQRFARAGFTYQYFGLARRDFEAYSAKDIALVKTDTDVFKRDDGFGCGGIHPGMERGKMIQGICLL